MNFRTIKSVGTTLVCVQVSQNFEMIRSFGAAIFRTKFFRIIRSFKTIEGFGTIRTTFANAFKDFIDFIIITVIFDNFVAIIFIVVAIVVISGYSEVGGDQCKYYFQNSLL